MPAARSRQRSTSLSVRLTRGPVGQSGYNHHQEALRKLCLGVTKAELAWYWSASPDANNNNNAWNVSFSNGNENNNNKNNNNHVRLVRGGE